MGGGEVGTATYGLIQSGNSDGCTDAPWPASLTGAAEKIGGAVPHTGPGGSGSGFGGGAKIGGAQGLNQARSHAVSAMAQRARQRMAGADVGSVMDLSSRHEMIAARKELRLPMRGDGETQPVVGKASGPRERAARGRAHHHCLIRTLLDTVGTARRRAFAHPTPAALLQKASPVS